MTESILFWLAAATVVLFAAGFVELARGGRRLKHLHQLPAADPARMPSVSIIIAARNEERGIEPALRSVLNQQGERIEVVVIDDRSDDATGAILDRMAVGEPRLRVVHVTELPAGWLGKNHALWLGAQAAQGELLLFTDADVVMQPDTVLRAARYLMDEGLDHLPIIPRVVMPGVLLTAFGVVFGIMFSFFTRPWKVRDPRSKAHVGIGAFNLVRADTYRRIGTHQAIAMRPDDDVKLGKLIKKNGGAQELVIGAEMMSVEWYHSVRETVRGLRKNGFAGVDYRLSVVIFATISQLVFIIWPFLAVWMTDGWTRALYAVAVGILLLMYAGSAAAQGAPVWHGILFPVASAMFIFVVWNATVYALVNRGIEWRGTHYPLDELKANRV
ncbi:MAG TPA: glycosyltransferase family 2 protein [Longimicrobium sp.]|jgi:cellulose synthase/poly-beta-1,6-N-acetylglucosamine synthase-like glycosyltransferase|nr:glycosyltransferase family 2 protein [Longimicrobium sp.]